MATLTTRILGFTVAAGALLAQGEAPLEYQVKAAFLYNFARFVEWPAGQPGEGGGPIVACVFGKDPFGATLDQTLEGKTVNGRAIVARRATGLAELKRCQIVFISASEKKRMAEILQSLASGGVLTVGETDHFGEHGGMVNFTREQNKVHLEINPEAAARAGLRISSQLLKLARVVRDEVEAGRH